MERKKNLTTTESDMGKTKKIRSKKEAECDHKKNER